MIHLDTHALIALPHWIRGGHRLVDRVKAEVRLAQAFIDHRIVALDAEHARLAAEFFNDSGRKRALQFDALIAATAIQTAAEFLTLNVGDFASFVPRGLKLFA